MNTQRNTSKCGTIQGAFAGAPAEKRRLFMDIADALQPLVAAVIAPRVEKNLVAASDQSVEPRLDHLWREVNDGGEMSPEEEEAIRQLGAPRILDPEERRQIAADVAADDARRLANVWLGKLSDLYGCGQFDAMAAVRGRALPSGCRLSLGEYQGEVLTADEANRILDGIADLSDAGDIFDLVNAYLVL